MIHQTSYIIYTARHYCNLLLLERSAPTHSRYYSIGVKLTPKCHGWLFGWVLKMKRFALSKKREMESEREADLCMKQAHSFLFFFFYHRPDFLQLQLHNQHVIFRSVFKLMHGPKLQPTYRFSKAKVLSLP